MIGGARRSAAAGLAAAILASACAGPALPPPGPPPAARAGVGVPLHEKAEAFAADLDRHHLLPWGGYAYRVGLPEGEGVEARVWVLADQAAWTGVLLGAEVERA